MLADTASRLSSGPAAIPCGFSLTALFPTTRTYELVTSIVPPEAPPDDLARTGRPLRTPRRAALGLSWKVSGSQGQLLSGPGATMRLRIPKWLGWPLLAAWTYIVLAFFAQRAIFHPSPYP